MIIPTERIDIMSFWSARTESPESGAERVLRMLAALDEVPGTPPQWNWRLTDWPLRKEKPFSRERASIEEIMALGAVRDDLGGLMEDLGFSWSLYSPTKQLAAISFSIGITNPLSTNRVSIRVEPRHPWFANLTTATDVLKIGACLESAWEPDWLYVAPYEIRSINITNNRRMGWITGFYSAQIRQLLNNSADMKPFVRTFGNNGVAVAATESIEDCLTPLGRQAINSVLSALFKQRDVMKLLTQHTDK